LKLGNLLFEELILTTNFVGLVPARSGSQRVKDKNLRLVGGKSLLERTANQALGASLISETFIATDSLEYESLACSYGLKTLGIRPKNISTSTSPDIEWLRWICTLLLENMPTATHYVLLRPTSPFRTPSYIDEAIKFYLGSEPTHNSTLRGLSPVIEHPGKMWCLSDSNRALRLLPFTTENTIWSDCQSSVLPSLCVQNASIEIGPIHRILDSNSSSSFDVIGYVSDKIDTFDINTIADLEYADFLAAKRGY